MNPDLVSYSWTGVNDFAVDENRCIERRRWVVRADWQLWFLGDIEVAAIAGACFGLVEIRGTGVKPEVHFRGFVLDASVGMSGDVIKKLVDAKDDVFPRAGGDGGCDRADGSLHGVVDGACIIVEDAGKFLAEFDLSGSELASGAGRFGVLLFLAIDGSGVRMRRVLRLFGWQMSKACKGFGDVVWHGEFDGAVLVIPVQMDATENFAFMVNGDIIMFLEAGN